MLWELIDLSDWKTKKQILSELKHGGIIIDERRLRKLVELQNKLFYNHESDIFIAHSSKGYKATKDYEEINNSLKDKSFTFLSKTLESKPTILKALREFFISNSLTNLSKSRLCL